MLAANYGHTGTVEILLRNGADVSAKDNKGWTALMAAASNGHSDALQALIQGGADVNAINLAGVTALMLAAGNNQSGAVQTLLANGADPNIKSGKGSTALSLATMQGYHKVAQLLSEAGESKEANSPDSERSSSHPVADSDPYVKECLEQKFREEPEVRKWDSDAVFQKVLGPLNSGDNSGACREAESLVPQFRDFANLYVWWASALIRMGSLDKARQLLTDGLERVKEKYPLCNRLGEIEWKARDLNRAVYWWAQGLQCQESLSMSNYGNSEGAYL